MIQPNNRRDNYKKKNTKGAAIAVAVVLLLQLASEFDSRNLYMLIAILAPVLGIAIFFFVFKVIGKSVEKSKAEVKSSRSDDGYCKTCSDDFVYNNRQNQYNENSAEQNFYRDKQRRLRQLDEFLKNGLIDKNEYMVLRSRYEK